MCGRVEGTLKQNDIISHEQFSLACHVVPAELRWNVCNFEVDLQNVILRPIPMFKTKADRR